MWGGPLEKHVTEPIEKNKFTQDLDKLDQGEVEVRIDCQETWYELKIFTILSGGRTGKEKLPAGISCKSLV